MAKDNRVRNVAFVAYPESAPDLLKQVDDWHIKACVILHDKDFKIDSETGEVEPLKPHYHCIVCFPGKQSHDRIMELIEPLGISYYERVNDLQAMSRYLTHRDHPNKHQYDVNEVLCFGGFDYEGQIEGTARRQEVLADIINYCKENNIVSFADLVDYAMSTRPDFFRELANHNTYFVREYIRSRSKRMH